MTDSVTYRKWVRDAAVKGGSDTFKSMALLTLRFAEDHLLIVQTGKRTPVDTPAAVANFKMITAYLNSNGKRNRFEGYWVNEYGDCVTFIKRESTKPLIYKSYVVESRNRKIIPGRLLCTYEQQAGNLFIGDNINTYSLGRYFLIAKFRNDSVLVAGAEAKWKKLRHYTPGLLATLEPFREDGSGGIMDSDTYLIRMPGCMPANKSFLDSIVHADSLKIVSRKNLIIDLSDNLGGQSRYFNVLWPFLYTNPIYRPSKHVLCTEGGIKDELHDLQADIAAGKADSADIKSWTDYISQERDSLGKYMSVPGGTIVCDTILPYPKNVGVIINYACRSAGELITLSARQSKKVTLFGDRANAF